LLKHPALDQLSALGLHGMAKAFAELTANGEAGGLGHHEWLGLLLDREASWRQDKPFAAWLRVAKLRQQASLEDIDYVVPAVLTARGSKSWRGRVDQRPRQFGPRRSDRHRQKLAGLSAWPQSLSRQSVGHLPVGAPSVRGPRAGARGRASAI
jgi:IstB-like ATP binding protein